MKVWLIRLTLLFVGFIIATFALELGLNKLAPNSRASFRKFHELDKKVGYKGIANAEGELKNGEIESYVKMNSHGFRDRERSYEKGKDVFRIVVLGDSIIEALQVPLEQAFTDVLERMLNSESDKRFEVINLGIAGFGTGQEYLTLKYYGLNYQPDLVILAFFLFNDIRNNSLTLDSKYSGRGINDRSIPYFVLNNGEIEELSFKIGKGKIIKTFLARLFPNIYYLIGDSVRAPWLVNLLWTMGLRDSVNRFRKKDISLSYYLYGEKYTPEWENAWAVTKALILEIAKELETNKIRFLVVVIPSEFEFRPDIWDKTLNENLWMRSLEFDLKKPERILSSFLKANGIDYLLLRPGFEKYTKETGKDLHFHYIYDNHWNANGNVVAGQLIYSKLKDDKLVQMGKDE
ncbi:MAG: hypothetical protein ACRENW_00840 [Thermodesulfobacteriota bacterium]